MTSTLNIVAGALLVSAADTETEEDLRVLSLYAQLAADRKGTDGEIPFTRHSDPLTWHRQYIAALKHFGMVFSTTDELDFVTVPGERETLQQWMDLENYPLLAQAMTQLASVAGDHPALRQLHAQALLRGGASQQLALLLQSVDAQADMHSWWVTLQTTQALGSNLFSEIVDGGALCSEIHISHRAGRLGPAHARFSSQLAQQTIAQRQAYVHTIDVSRKGVAS